MRRILFAFIIVLLFAWQMPVFAQEGGEGEYTIQPGDTLIVIAERFNVPVELLAQINDISDPDLIQAGQTLVIPDQAAVQADQRKAQVHAFLEANRVPLMMRVLRAEEVYMQVFGPETWQASARFIPIAVNRDATLPLPFLHVDAPVSIVQGDTGVVHVTTLAPITPLGSFQGRDLVFIGEGARTSTGFHFFALLPTGALDKVEAKSLELTIGEVSVVRSVQIAAGIFETQHIVLPPSKGSLLEPTKLRNELKQLHSFWDEVNIPPQWKSHFRFPIAEGFPRTSPYGTRRSYNGGPVSSFHAGSDWGAPEGTPILAPAPGVVVLAEPLFVRGGGVVINHGAGVYSNFWHMSRIDVHPGDVVTEGQQLGLVGTTGLSTGAHLHWEIRIDGIAVNPMQWTTTDFP